MSSNVSENAFAIHNLTIQLFTRRKSTVAVETTICVVLNIAALLLNAFLCWAVYNNHRLRRVTNIYVLALSLTDLLMASLVMPFLCSVSIHGRWISSWSACQFQGYWCVVLAYTAQLMFPLTAVNRYVRVLYPQIYMKVFVKKYILLSISVVSILALCAPLPFLLRGHEFAFHPGMMICFYTIENAREKQAIYRIVFFTILPMLIVTFCYLRIYRVVKRHATKRLRRVEEAPTVPSKLSVDDIVMTKTLFAIIFAFFVCWTPLYILTAIDTAHGEFRLPRQAYFFATYLVGLSSIANPIIFGYMNATFREELKKLMNAIGLKRFSKGKYIENWTFFANLIRKDRSNSWLFVIVF